MKKHFLYFAKKKRKKKGDEKKKSTRVILPVYSLHTPLYHENPGSPIAKPLYKAMFGLRKSPHTRSKRRKQCFETRTGPVGRPATRRTRAWNRSGWR